MEARFATGQRPETVFQKTGLRVRGPWPFPRAANRNLDLPPAERFRSALEELGGLYASFGQFLGWRADLLRADYAAALRPVRAHNPPVPREDFIAALKQDLGTAGELLADKLEGDPLWSTINRCAWRSTWEDQPVVVQLSRAPVSKSEYRKFERGLRALREPGILPALTPEVLRQFQQWLRIPDSTPRERAYLDTLSGFGQKLAVEYPRPIPEVCGGRILVWPWIEGEAVASAIERGSAETVRKLAEGILEQTCLLSVVDADLDGDFLVVAKDGRLVFQRANRLVSIPGGMVRSVLKYISAVVAGDSSYANRQLVRLASGHTSAQAESRLFDELSNLEPELKINLRFPASVGAFESNWRAAARITRDRPLYLDMLHRNLIQLGYLDAETAESGSSPDAVADAQWRVLGRLLRTRLGELTADSVKSQWVLGSGLLFLEGLRQSALLADGFRDNQLTLHFAYSQEEQPHESAGAVSTGLSVALLLVVFLVCLRFAPRTPAPWSWVITALAVAAAGGLLWKLSRVG
jgi:hypothetical protein